MVHKKKSKLPREVSEFISDQIKIEMEAGRPQAQSIAMAFSMARKNYPQYEHLLKR